MPAKIIESVCTGCNGTGYSNFTPCSCLSKRQDGVKVDCDGCKNLGAQYKSCSSCNGTGKYQDRIWVLGSEMEANDFLADLEEAYAKMAGVWPLIDAVRKASDYLKEDKWRLLPYQIIERANQIEATIPARCLHCEGRGSDRMNAKACSPCNATGFKRN